MGNRVGWPVGNLLGWLLGCLVGCLVGCPVGWREGCLVGCPVGCLLGCDVGWPVGDDRLIVVCPPQAVSPQQPCLTISHWQSAEDVAVTTRVIDEHSPQEEEAESSFEAKTF